jgi:hypothetical protein
MPRSPHILVALLGAAALAAGCGEDAPQDRTVDRSERPAPGTTQTRSLRDPVGDVKRYPPAERRHVAREQLDLRSVTLSRDRSGLTVGFHTVSPPGGGMVQVFEVYDRRQLVEGAVEIRYAGGEPRAVIRPPGGRFEPARVTVEHGTARVRMPANAYTRERVFKWRAYTSSTEPTREVRDRLPSRVGGVAFFPG